jgi:hypothetical protein
MMVLGINSDAWRTVSKAADTNIIPQHKLKFNPGNHSMDEATTSSLKKYFEGLKEHACPRATRVVQTHAGTALRDDSDEEDEDDCEEREQILIDAAKHCCNAKGQREYFNRLTAEAKEANYEGMAHIVRRWVLVADYCQNMGIPHFGGEQPGKTYYFSPLSCYCFGAADPLCEQDRLYANLYHEGQGQKGGNNVASLLFKVLKHIGALKEDEFGGPMTIVMDD